MVCVSERRTGITKRKPAGSDSLPMALTSDICLSVQGTGEGLTIIKIPIRMELAQKGTILMHTENHIIQRP